MLFVVLCPGTPEGSTGSVSGFKASQKTGQGLKSHPTDWEKPGIGQFKDLNVSKVSLTETISIISSSFMDMQGLHN